MLAENIFADLPQLETERLILRRLRLEDAQDVFDYASNPEVARYVSFEQHKSVDDAIAFLNMVVSSYEDTATKAWTWGIVLKENGKLIGSCGIWGKPEHARAEIGYVIGQPYWGRGLVSEAVREVIRLGFDNLGLNRIEARCDPENIGSARVMEKSGMTYEGILREQTFIKGRYWDWKLYSILRREYYGQEDKSNQG